MTTPPFPEQIIKNPSLESKKQPVGCGRGIYRLHLWRRLRPSTTTTTTTKKKNDCPGYDTRLFHGEVPIVELWRMWSTRSLPLLLSTLWPRVVAPVRVPSIGQIKIFNDFSILETIYLYAIKWDLAHLKLTTNYSFIYHMNKHQLA